jgi:hypothetical protein
MLTVTLLHAQGRKDRAIDSPLFQENSVLNIDLTFNIKEVTRDIKVRDEHWGELSYRGPDGEQVTTQVKIEVRGKNRSNPNVCTFPPLRLNFKKKGNYDNLFAGQDKLKLVTHCKGSKVFDQYVIQEYLTYKQYQLLSDYSFQVRLLKVNYIDSASNEPYAERYGVMIEDEDILAHRLGMESRKESVLTQDFCEKNTLDVLAVFQFMIGNTDWSVTEFHNIKLLQPEDPRKPPIPVPYDFDYAGAIATHYSVPHELMPITDVRQRFFLGYCRQEGTYEKVFELFNDKKEDMYAIYQNSAHLAPHNLKEVTRYFDKFYDIINHPRKSKSQIIKACRVPHKHLFE